MDWSNEFTSGDLRILVNVAISMFCGYMIGWEREFRGSEAGNRTFSLVAIGAAAFTGLGVEYFPETAEKVFAGIVSGVGFLGAGLIFKGNEGVHGLTTAASLWAVAGVGTVVGADRPVLGIAIACFIVFVLEMENMPGLKKLHVVSHGRETVYKDET